MFFSQGLQVTSIFLVKLPVKSAIIHTEQRTHHTCLVDSILRGDMYWVLTSQETPLSVGLSFFLMPSVLIGVIGSSSRNNSSSSGSRGILSPFGGLINREWLNKSDEQINQTDRDEREKGERIYLYTLRSRRSRGIPRSGSTCSWGFQFFSNDVIWYLQYLQIPYASDSASKMNQFSWQICQQGIKVE